MWTGDYGLHIKKHCVVAIYGGAACTGKCKVLIPMSGWVLGPGAVVLFNSKSAEFGDQEENVGFMSLFPINSTELLGLPRFETCCLKPVLNMV